MIIKYNIQKKSGAEALFRENFIPLSTCSRAQGCFKISVLSFPAYEARKKEENF